MHGAKRRLRVLGGRDPGEPRYTYPVLMGRALVVTKVQKAVGAGRHLRDMLGQTDGIKRGAVRGMASQVGERLAVHPPEIKEGGPAIRACEAGAPGQAIAQS